MTNQKTKREMKQDQKAAFMQALVDKFGEGAVVSRKDLIDVWKSAPGKFCHVVGIRKNPDYKVGRNMFVVTTSKTPAVVRDAVIAERQKMVPADSVKNDVKALAKLVRDGMSKSEKQASKKSSKKTTKLTEAQKANVHNGLDVDANLDSDTVEDINDIMRVMQN